MIRTAEETALLIALLLQQAGLKRGRISEKTIRKLSKRSHLRRAFMGMLEAHLNDLGLILVELDRGGYGIMGSSALEGAPALTAKKYLHVHLEKLRQERMSFDDIRQGLEEDATTDDEDA